MPDTESNAIMTIAMLAAFADGLQNDHERDAIKRMLQSLARDHDAPQLAQLYQDVLLKRVTLQETAAALTTTAQRQLAYETAVCICDADGVANTEERAFLAQLQTALGLDDAGTGGIEREAHVVAAAPLTHADAAAPASPTQPIADLDQYILNHAIVNGAIELLPQSLASMAIIPLQVKMVYRIGQAHGYQLDQGHIREFIATVGVGLTAQYLEQFGRKLLGGLFGAVTGSLGRGVGSVATGAAFSFATTYALGQLAVRYYGGGRQMNTALLQSTYQSLLSEARQLQQQNLSQIRDKARSLDLGQVLSMVRN